MDLFYRQLGEGHPLIIIHGLYGSSDNWMSIGKILAEKYQVFLIDQRNHGESGHHDEHNYPAMREDLKDFMDKHNLQKATLLGHSMGGKTAIYFAAEYPERVERLIVVDISPCSYKDADSFQTKTHTQIINALQSINLNTLKSRSEADKQLSEYIQQKRIRQFLLKNLYRNEEKEFRWKLNLPILKKHLSETMDGFTADTVEKDVTGFPVLFIRGEESDYIQEKDIEATKKLFPMAEIVSIPNAGHWVHAEQPDAFLKAVNTFLED
ncbi:MAG: alpha/beta fold hydrolase [Bacteroidota bacterium]